MTTQSSQVPSGKFLVTAALVVILAVLGYYVLNEPDKRSAGEKIGDAIDELGDRTPSERLGDNLKKITK